MIESLHSLIESLRDELHNYGEMLALLDRQQEFLRTQASHEVVESVSQIDAQGRRILEARQRREDGRREVADAASQPEDVSFAELIPVLPVDYQPLLEALVDENNELLLRVRRRARQNHLMLKRSVETMQQLLKSLRASTSGSIASAVETLAMPFPRSGQLHEELN